MRRGTVLVGVLALAAVFAACSDGPRKSSNATSARVAPAARAGTSGGDQLAGQASAAGGSTQSAGAAAAPAATPSGLAVAAAPKIVRNGSVSVEVGAGGFQSAFDQLAGLATTSGGFVADSGSSTTKGVTSGRIVLRLPSAQLDNALAVIGRLGKVQDKQLKGDDVGAQLVDLDARITSLQAEETAYRTLVGQAKAVNDVLAVQNELFQVRQQIEQLTAQKASLDQQVTYATLEVRISEPAPTASPKPEEHPNPIVRAARLARDNSAAIARGAVLALGWSFPLLVLAGVAALAWLPIRRRIRPVQRPT